MTQKLSVLATKPHAVPTGVFRKIGKVLLYVAATAARRRSSRRSQYGEHDVGKIDVDGEAVIFKIDYYSLDEMHGSDHPEDPNVTVRVMTIMFAEDYR